MNITFFTDNTLCAIPVHPQTKRPKPSEWQKRHAKHNNAADFSPDANVGVVLGTASGGLVDIDLDSDLARKLAPHFLPPTGWVFGREGAPRSHYLYRVAGEPGPGRKFDVEGKFAEYRANGQMTVFPGSVHESGKPIEWATCDSIGESSRSELLDRVSWMSICAIILPFYRPGSRNDIVLAMAGTVLRGGKSEQDVLRLVEVLCDHTDDDEKQARLETVCNTARRIQTGQRVAQLGRLRELIGEAAIDKLQVYLGASDYSDGLNAEKKRAAILDVEDRNDSGLGELFAARVVGRLRFAKDEGCFYVCGPDGIWSEDDQALEVGLEFDSYVQDRLDQLERIAGISSRDREDHRRFLLKYRNRSNARNAVKQSRSLLSIETSEFDARDDVVAVRNGLLNLREGLLTPCRPEHYITRRLNIAFDPAADCPVFRRVLADAFNSDDALIEYFTGLMGYWLTGFTDRQECYVLHGEGANGKSTLVNAITHVIGGYASCPKRSLKLRGGRIVPT